MTELPILPLDAAGWGPGRPKFLACAGLWQRVMLFDMSRGDLRIPVNMRSIAGGGMSGHRAEESTARGAPDQKATPDGGERE